MHVVGVEKRGTKECYPKVGIETVAHHRHKSSEHEITNCSAKGLLRNRKEWSLLCFCQSCRLANKPRAPKSAVFFPQGSEMNSFSTSGLFNRHRQDAGRDENNSGKASRWAVV
jgi:hypothetical protein